MRFGPYYFTTSNEDKILFPKNKITKGELIEYYEKIGPIMVPFMKDRPISMVRYPNGIKEKGFFQKDAGSHFPDWITTIQIEREGVLKDTKYVIVNNVATLVYLANQACITPHLWLSKIDKINYPDRLIFDLDPSIDNFAQVQKGAMLLKKELDKLDIPNFVMTTGSRGLHIVTPLKRIHTFEWVRSFALDIANILIEKNPSLFTVEIRKNKRGKKIFIDTLRNAFAQTAVAPYAVRPKPGAPVATPLEWEEITKNLRPNQYTIKNIFQRSISFIKISYTHNFIKNFGYNLYYNQ